MGNRGETHPLQEVLAVQQGAVQPAGADPHGYRTVKTRVSTNGPLPSPPDGSSVCARKV